MKQIVLATVLLTVFSSCLVSKKKFDDILAQKVRMEADLADRNAQIDKGNTDQKTLNEQLSKLREDTTNIGIDLRNSAKRLAELEKEHGQLNNSYKSLTSSSGKMNT